MRQLIFCVNELQSKLLCLFAKLIDINKVPCIPLYIVRSMLLLLLRTATAAAAAAYAYFMRQCFAE